MKREFWYKLQLEIDEPSKPKGDNSQSLVDRVLRTFELQIKTITIKQNNTKLSVKSLETSSPEESEEAAEHRKKTKMLLEILTKDEGSNKPDPSPNYLLRIRQRLRNKSLCQ